jgi:ATP phosphoribosyltransferase
VEYLTVAVPKGNLFDESLKLLEYIGFPANQLKDENRKLIFTDTRAKMKVVVTRNFDVPVYVEHGAADFGIVGKDVIAEMKPDVMELLDLKYGRCTLCLAGRGKEDPKFLNNVRVATKYPNLASHFLSKEGIRARIIKLHGNIELAPLLGLSTYIVDLVATGRTLKENNLSIIKPFFSSSARLIANPFSWKLKRDSMLEFFEKARIYVEERSGSNASGSHGR